MKRAFFNKAEDYLIEEDSIGNNTDEDIQKRLIEAERLKEFANKYRGMSLYKMGQGRVSEPILYRMNAGNSKISRMQLDTIIKLCTWMDITLDEFVSIVLFGDNPEDVLPKARLYIDSK